MLARVSFLIFFSLGQLACASAVASASSVAATPGANAAPPPATQTAALAALMRVSIDGKAAGKDTVEKVFNYENILLRHAGEHGFTYVDLTPLKDDFQKLRYSHQCAITGGAYSRDDCADFGNYAEAVLAVLANIDEAIRQKQLPTFGSSDRILLGDTRIMNFERRIRVEMYMRVYSANGQKLLHSDSLSREMQLGSKATREGMTIKLLNLVLADGIHKLAAITQ